MTLEIKTYTNSAMSDLIKGFLSEFKDSNGKYRYVDSIDQAYSRDKPLVIINPKDFLESDLDEGLKINDLIYSDPVRFVTALDRAVKEIFQQRHNRIDISVQLNGVEKNISIVQALSKDNIGQLITTQGMIVYKSKIFNKLTKAVYVCKDNHHTIIESSVTDSDINEPIVCDNVSCKLRQFTLENRLSDYETYRNIAIKSDDDFSFTNDELNVSLSGELTEAVEAGDRIRLTGLVNTKNKPKSSLFINEIHCLYVQKLDDIDLNITKEDEEVFRSMIEETDFYQRMINSISPTTLGNEDVKESLLLQLARSPNRIKSDGTINRGWLNIGLWGDAGVAKTAMAEHIQANYPKTQIISSKGATDVGLTLGIDQDATGNKVLRAGAFVLNRGYGIVIIDEFPRLNPEVIDGIYTTIESGFASIAKAGFQAKQRADSSLLATGNAYSEDWNDNLNLKDNLNISTALLQRFDYHWIIKDSFNKQRDEDIADAVINGITHEESFKPYSSELLVKYFKFIRKFEPVLSDEVAIHIKNAYVELRTNESAIKNGIGVRQLNTLIRTTLAISRIYQRRYSSIEDVEKAIALMRKNMSQRGISVAEADTYTIRQFNRCITILKECSMQGISIEDLLEKLHTVGSKEQIEQTKIDLGVERNQNQNKKWRNVVGMLRRSIMITIISNKPMILAYKHEKRN